MEFLEFSWVDYTLFFGMLGLSVVVGLYFGFCGKQDTAVDYLQGGRKMKIFPVTMSLVACTLSGIALVGVPAEIYVFGTQYWMMTISLVFLGFAINFIYLPVFYKLQLVSIFEYLELRFDRKIRTLSSVLFTFTNLLGLPVIIYAPSLAFNQVTGFDLHLIASAMSLICIFYTTIGGVKAVVWADTLQFSVTLCTLGCVLIMGTISVGGLWTIWEKAELGNRLEFFNMDLDPTLRGTFWSVVIGNVFIWTSFIGATPGTIQRFLAVPTLNDAKKVLVIFVIFTIITDSISCFSGLIIYAKYMDCDPLTAGFMKKADQIVPYYVLDVASQIPGLSGLFVAGLLSTTLSTLSTFLNALAGTMYEDFVAPFMPVGTSEKTASTIMKVLTAVVGFGCVGLIFVVERLGSILQLIHSVSGITGGPVFGLFTLGMLFPMANYKGALAGALSSTLFMAVVIIKAQVHIWNGIITSVARPLETHGCNITSAVNASVWSLSTDPAPEEPHWLFRISFYYYTLMGTFVTLAVGLLVSWATRNGDTLPTNPDLFSPCVHRFLPKSSDATCYESVEKALHELQVYGPKQNVKKVAEIVE